MSTTLIAAPTKSVSISAVVRRADGSVKEDLGVVAYWHRNPLKRLWYMVSRALRRKRWQLLSAAEALEAHKKMSAD